MRTYYQILYITILIFKSSSVTNLKSDCLKLRELVGKRSSYLNGHCLVLHSSQYKTQSNAKRECQKLYADGQLARIYNQAQLDAIANTIDLSNSAWIGLERDANDNNKWQYDTKQADDVLTPWAANQSETTGDGALVRYHGILKANTNLLHEFICEFSENTLGNSQFTGGKPLAASNPILDHGIQDDIHDCGIMCHEDRSCQSYTYNSASKECKLYWLSAQELTLTNDPNSKLFSRPNTHPSCLSESDCLLDIPKLLVAGGRALISIESFYPDKPTKNQIVANFGQAQYGSVGIQLGSKALIVGGLLDGGSPLNTAYLLDLNTNTLTPTVPMAESRVSAGLALLDGVAIVCGGWGAATWQSCEQFSENQWSAFPSLSIARKDFELVATANKLFALGGQGADNIGLLEVDSFDAVSNSWSISTAPLPAGQKLIGAAVLGDEVYVCRGFNDPEMCHKYSVASDQWTSIALLEGSHGPNGVYHCLKVLHGRLYAFGGSEIEVYDVNNDQWQILATQLIEAREFGLMLPVTF